MSDLVERLLATGGKGQGGPLKKEAAAEIKRLRAELAQADGVINALTMPGSVLIAHHFADAIARFARTGETVERGSARGETDDTTRKVEHPEALSEGMVIINTPSAIPGRGRG